MTARITSSSRKRILRPGDFLKGPEGLKISDDKDRRGDGVWKKRRILKARKAQAKTIRKFLRGQDSLITMPICSAAEPIMRYTISWARTLPRKRAERA